jgi:hypothetical protein
MLIFGSQLDSRQSAFDPFFQKGVRQYYLKFGISKISATRPLMPLFHRGQPTNPLRSDRPVALQRRDEPWGGLMRQPSQDETHPFCSVSMQSGMTTRTLKKSLPIREIIWRQWNPIRLLGLYVNFAGLGEEGEKLVRDAYGSHYDRLRL